MVPVLRLAFGFAPADAAGTSLALVIANSASGATTYLLQRRVHVRLGLLVAAGGLPGGILGAIAVKNVSAQTFDWAFAAFLLLVAADMVFARRARTLHREGAAAEGMPLPRALATGFAVGFVSSLFGVGGGVVLIPSLLYFSDLPTHAISATSHFGIFLTSPVGFITHVLQKDVLWRDVVPLVLGGIAGGPIGARLSLRLHSQTLTIVIACALAIAAMALISRHFVG